MKTRKWILTILLAWMLTMPVSPVSAAPSASITITPPLPNPVPVDGEVSFAIVISVTDINPGVAGADIYLAYDPALVEPLPSPDGAVEPLPDFFGSSNVTWHEVLPRDKCPGGTNPCIHLVAAGPAQVTQYGAAARFHFQIKSGGKACFWVLASTLANKDGFPVDHTVINIKPNPQCVNSGPTVIGTVLRQGTPAGYPNLGGGTLACSVVTLDGRTDFTDESGKFEFANVSSGTYRLGAEYSGYLASGKTITVPGGTMPIDAGQATLCGGDVNADSKINILDIGAIIGNFGSTGVPVRSDLQEGCTDPDEPTDINDDGLVNISDLAIAAGNWTHTGPKPWRTDQCDP